MSSYHELVKDPQTRREITLIMTLQWLGTDFTYKQEFRSLSLLRSYTTKLRGRWIPVVQIYLSITSTIMKFFVVLTSLLMIAFLSICDGAPRAVSEGAGQSQEVPAVLRQIPAEDVASDENCDLYANIRARGYFICTDECRPFDIDRGSNSAYVDNVSCACEAMPKDVETGKKVRMCLQRKLINASSQGKVIWTAEDVSGTAISIVRRAT